MDGRTSPSRPTNRSRAEAQSPPLSNNPSASGSATHRHPYARTPSTEPPRFHLSQQSSISATAAASAAPYDAGNGTLAVDIDSVDASADLDQSPRRISSMPVTKSWPNDTPSRTNGSLSYPSAGHVEPQMQREGYALEEASQSYASTSQRPIGGYTSSTDGDLTPFSSSKTDSRAQTPLVGVNLTDEQIADMTESEVSEYDEHAKLRRNKRAAESLNSGPSSVLSSIGKSLKPDSFWGKPSGSYTPLTAARSRSTKKSKWPRNSKSDKMLFSSSAPGGSNPRSRSRRAGAWAWSQPLRMLASFLSKLFRTVFGPIHPITIIVALVLIASFVASVTKLIVYILNPDKEPLPWRTYCQQQPSFPHAYADVLAPVDVFVGVFSIDSAYDRRHLIRSTYAGHTLPTDPNTGAPTSNVQVKFIVGKPRQSHARRVALEMETFNDLVVLDMEENMNRGKTHAFFRWAAENATVPFLRPIDADQESSYLATGTRGNGYAQTREIVGGTAENPQRYEVAWKKADYVVKADDDAYIILEELERHLRVAPRQMTYWGYLIRNWFMGGECYALSNDLVQYVATSEQVLHYTKGKEDKKVAQWINLHPNRSSIHWVSEHCWIYDHPKAGTAYSHGFLFPDYVEKIKLEGRRGLTDQEIARRGGEHRAKSYSTVTRWHSPYVEPRSDLTIEEEVEALVEGGGRWSGSWVRGEEGNETQVWVPWEQMVFEANDQRLRPPQLSNLGTHPALAEEVGIDPASGLTIRRVHQQQRLPQQQVQQQEDRRRSHFQSGSDGNSRKQEKRDIPFLAHLPSVPGFDFGSGGVSRNAAEERRRSFAATATQPRLIPLATHKDGNGEIEELRERRYLGRRFGGTVVVHYLKKSEWFYETALAFSGRNKFWSDGAGGTGSEWRMYGSPLVRHDDGYISGGRSQPRPDMELAYLQQARIQAQANAAQAQGLAARMGSFTKPKPASANKKNRDPQQQRQNRPQEQETSEQQAPRAVPDARSDEPERA